MQEGNITQTGGAARRSRSSATLGGGGNTNRKYGPRPSHSRVPSTDCPARRQGTRCWAFPFPKTASASGLAFAGSGVRMMQTSRAAGNSGRNKSAAWTWWGPGESENGHCQTTSGRRLREWPLAKLPRKSPCLFSFRSHLLNCLCFSELGGWVEAVYFSRSVVSGSATPWSAARQASLSITNSRSLLKLTSI